MFLPIVSSHSRAHTVSHVVAISDASCGMVHQASCKCKICKPKNNLEPKFGGKLNQISHQNVNKVPLLEEQHVHKARSFSQSDASCWCLNFSNHGCALFGHRGDCFQHLPEMYMNRSRVKQCR